MKRLLLFAAISAGWVEPVVAQPVAAQPVADPAKQAAALLESGLVHFQAREYGAAFADFAGSYKFVQKASTAALACQAQANADPTHPSAAITWLSKWQSNAAKETLDGKGWRAVQRAHAAIGDSVVGVEARIDTLTQANRELERKIASLEEQNRRLEFKMRAIAIDFRGSLLAPDRDRLDATLRAASGQM